MRTALTLAALLLVPAAACAVPNVPRIVAGAPMSEAARIALETTARRVRSCYRAPRVSSEGRLIVTTLRVRLAPDGTLGGLPEVLSQDGVNPVNQLYAGRMAEAAILSVIRCAPYRLPVEFADGDGIEIELTFSPGAAV